MHLDPNRSEQQGDCAAQLVAALGERKQGLGSREFDEAFRACLDAISRSVRAQYPRLAAADIEDIAAESVWALIERVKGAGEIESPGRWLFVVARNKAADVTREVVRTAPAEDPLADVEQPAEDPNIAALIDALADKALVHAAKRLARERGDRTALRVVVTWLELYSRADESVAPTLRQLGEEADISHQGASDALARFRGYLEEVGADPVASPGGP
jgi:DNA-directed RNA polymerase specialized sigma24 family protein